MAAGRKRMESVNIDRSKNNALSFTKIQGESKWQCCDEADRSVGCRLPGPGNIRQARELIGAAGHREEKVAQTIEVDHRVLPKRLLTGE